MVLIFSLGAPPWACVSNSLHFFSLPLSGILNLATASSRPSSYPCDCRLVAAGSDRGFSVCELLPVQLVLVCAAVVCDYL